MRVLITGAAGFIGMHLSAALMHRGHQVVGFDNLSGITYDRELKLARLRNLGLEISEATMQRLAAGEALQKEGFTFYQQDLCDREKLQALVSQGNFEVVVNLAALAGVRLSTEIPEQYVQSNFQGFFNLLEVLKSQPVEQRSRLVFASSSSVYGDCKVVPFAESNTDIKPKSVYAATKQMDETIAYAYASLFKIDAIGLRFFTVYGPYGRPDMAPFIFLKSFLEGKEITLFNEGKSRRDFTYVGDIVEGVVKVIEGPDQSAKAVPFDVFNIGNGSPVGLFDFVHTLEEISGKKAQIKLAGMPKGDVEQTYADVTKLKQVYGYQPHTNLREGLQHFYDWYCAFYKPQAKA